MALSSVSADRRRRGQVEIELAGRRPGWQSVPVAGALPAAAEVRVAVRGTGEGTARLSEARVLSQPVLAANDPIAIAYPLHGECFDHQVYVRGFVRGAVAAGPTLAAVAGDPGAIDADGASRDVPEPAARGESLDGQDRGRQPVAAEMRRAPSRSKVHRASQPRIAGASR